jgi:hypothetical protein
VGLRLKKHNDLTLPSKLCGLRLLTSECIGAAKPPIRVPDPMELEFHGFTNQIAKNSHVEYQAESVFFPQCERVLPLR